MGGLPQHTRPPPQARRRRHPVHAVLGRQRPGSLRPTSRRLGGFDAPLRGLWRGGLRLRLSDFERFVGRAARQQQAVCGHDGRDQDASSGRSTQFEEYGSRTSTSLRRSILRYCRGRSNSNVSDPPPVADRVFVASTQPDRGTTSSMSSSASDHQRPAESSPQLQGHRRRLARLSLASGEPMKLAILGSRGIPPCVRGLRDVRLGALARAGGAVGTTSPSTRTAAGPTRRGLSRPGCAAAGSVVCAASTWRP